MNLKKRLKKLIVAQIDTETNRIPYLKTALIGTTIVVGISAIVLLQSPTTHSVRGKQYTDNEYQQLKSAEIAIISNRKSSMPTFDEAEIWKEIVSVECKNIVLYNVNSDTVIDQLNNYLSNGCKE